MSLFRKTQSIKAQIVDTKRLLDLVLGHRIMSKGLVERLKLLNLELESLPKQSYEPKIQLLFSGNAVVGSQGIKTTFVSKAMNPFQEMVKTQVALIRFGKVGKRGQAKNRATTELYLTALPVGSFGVELSHLESNDLFDEIDVSNAMKDVMSLVANSAKDDETFESSIEHTPKRNLSNLKKFLHEITHEKSVLKMECGELGIELTKEKIFEACQRVSSTIDEQSEIFVEGIFRGLLLDSGKFEIQDNLGKSISGFISQDIKEEQLVEYDKSFLNKNCTIQLRVHKTKFKTGNEKTDYELLEISSK
jgi:hypothetical protein